MKLTNLTAEEARELLESKKVVAVLSEGGDASGLQQFNCLGLPWAKKLEPYTALIPADNLLAWIENQYRLACEEERDWGYGEALDNLEQWLKDGCKDED